MPIVNLLFVRVHKTKFVVDLPACILDRQYWYTRYVPPFTFTSICDLSIHFTHVVFKTVEYIGNNGELEMIPCFNTSPF